MASDRSEFVIVYGRRRVGKTFLVDQYYQGSYDFTFVGGHNLSRQRQLTNFSRALKKFSGKKPDKFADRRSDIVFVAITIFIHYK